jgi:hypothetical protein
MNFHPWVCDVLELQEALLDHCPDLPDTDQLLQPHGFMDERYAPADLQDAETYF